MKKLIRAIAVAAAFFAWSAFSGEISEEQARTVAENFIAKDAAGQRVLPDRTVDAVTKRGGLYLVTLKPSGHILVSANRAAEPIVTFSENDFTEPETGSPQAALLGRAEINSINATGTQYETRWCKLLGAKTPVRAMTASATEYLNIEPMLKSSWTQNYPYNELMPVVNGTRTLVGCVATAYSQVMRYWQWPEVLNEDIVTEHSVDALWGHKWRLKAGTVFDWQDMPYSGGYDNMTLLKLGRATMFAGMLARMTYNTGASGAQTSQPGQNGWYTQPRVLDSSNSTLVERESGMKQSLMNECPFMVSVDTEGGGHAVVGDGWQESASGSYVHLNYGWGFNNSYYATSVPLGVYLDAKPRPMVMNKPLPTQAKLPLTVEWFFPSKGYDNTLTGFTVSYTEVEDTIADWSDDMSIGKGAIEGDCISVETVDSSEHGSVLRIGTKADEETYTLPTLVVTKDTVFSYDIRSCNALGMFVEVQLLDPSVGWITLATPEISERSEIDWSSHSFDLGQYAGKGIAIRVKATRLGSSSYNDDKARSTGVQLDDFKLTNVRLAKSAVAGTSSVNADSRAAVISDAALVAEKTYLFQVSPVFNDENIIGISGYQASCTIVATDVEKPMISSVESVVASAPKVRDGMFRQCYFGLNQFGVYGSASLTKLEAYLSNLVVIGEVEEPDATQPTGTMITVHNKVSIENAVKVEKKTNGRFLVTVDASNLTDYLRYSGMILTLVGRNESGDAVQKDLCLEFAGAGGETPIAVADLPEAGTIAGGGGDIPVQTVYRTVIFSTEGTAVSPATVEDGKAIGTLPTTSRDGYTFLGWFTAKDGGTQIVPAQIITGNVTYYAHWEVVSSGGDTPGESDEPTRQNDFTEGGKTYRFCIGVNKTSGYKDVNRNGIYTYQIPAAYNLVQWWGDAYKSLNGAYPTGFVAPTSLVNETNPFSLHVTASALFKDAIGQAMPTDAERSEYFPNVEFSPVEYCGGATGDEMQKAVGRRVYADLKNGPIGCIVKTSATSTSRGAVIWGCEYVDDVDGKRATLLYITSTRANNDGIESYQLNVISIDGVGTMPGLKNFNSSAGGVITTYYPIVGPAGKPQGGGGGDDEPVIPGQHAGGDAVDTGTIDTSYGFRLVYNYWLARKLALLENKKLFILSGASWCSYCTKTKEYMQTLGKDFTDKFVVYYVDRDNLEASPYFKGGLPQYGSADPRTVNPFAGIYSDGSSTTPDWTKAWYAADSNLYYGNRGGFSQEQVNFAISSANNGAAVGDFDHLEIRGPVSVMSDKANTYRLYAIFADGSEMLVDHGVTWSLKSGNGTMTVSTTDGDASAKFTVASDQAVLRAESTYYFNGTAEFTVKSTQESKIKGLSIVTDSINLEDNRSPVLKAKALLDDDTEVEISGIGTWTINSESKIPRNDAELESNQEPNVSVDEFGRLTYSQGYQFDVYDHTLNVTLAANGISAVKNITVWGPTKVAPVSWTVASKTHRLTKYGVVRLKCEQLKYNYGGEIKTTSDTYYGKFRTVMQFVGGSTEYSYLRGLAFMSPKEVAGTWQLGLQAQRVNGQYQYWTPENFAYYHSETIENVAEGDVVTDADHGLVTEGFFNACWPMECADMTKAQLQSFALFDSDSDGFSNWEEYILGTDPTDANDALTLTQGYQHLTAPANDLEAFQYKIMFAQRPGRYYYLYAKVNWGDAWTRVAKINYSGMSENQGMQIEILNQTEADNGKFFRVGAVLADHEFYSLSNAEVIPNMLVAAPGSTIDLTNEPLPMSLVSFDTDATHAGIVNVVVPENARTPGKVLMSAPKVAVESLKACRPKDSGDIAFAIVEEKGRLLLKVAGDEPAVEEGKGHVAVEDGKIVVMPYEGVTDIALVNVGDNLVEIPSSVVRVAGVGDSKKLIVKSGTYDVTESMKFMPVNGGIAIELNEEAVVKVGDEEISVRPVLADGKDEVPFAIRDGKLHFTVKAIPGLKYQVLASDSLDHDSFTPAGQECEATSTRRELTVTRSCETNGFFKVWVGR